ncbi:uncharacterized protein AMSG_10558 [Thecamonas trahens ATCC 50062]|uniref:PSI domain-containing protein n=1 Tax=Thecamonas trahens ATCC 50062 TaxID=461836 RepID=A0A0L0DS86_THETB|nr:hypothetical protein AMSG_10558 [Thecamonas trahens ATCC 50062]KNC54901.1 hypothetical protein AMSG_10558 [Thecamonas trahens ATCC 50062]|eukprot:XP_013753492.1 hypothetical protein AMSG_10558 [Thecamonas trahens ATCC 50062]
MHASMVMGLVWVVIIASVCNYAVALETSEQCIIHNECGACLLEQQASCGWCEVESKCSELNPDGTIACSRGQVIYTGYCPSGEVPQESFFERKDSDKGGFTHGYVGLALFLAVLVLWRIFRTFKGRRDKAAGRAHRRQDEAWRVMRQFRAQVEMEKRRNKKLTDAGFIYDVHYDEPAAKHRDELVDMDEHVTLGATPAGGVVTGSGGVAAPKGPPPQRFESDDGDVEMTPLARETEAQIAVSGAAYMNFDAASSSSYVDEAETKPAPPPPRRAPPARLRRRDESFSSSSGGPPPSSDDGESGSSGYSSPPGSASSSGPPPPI